MAKIVNICLSGPYTDGLTYQDNLLPKYQKRNGNDVVIIAPTDSYSESGEDIRVDEGRFVDSNGIEVIRINADKGASVRKRFRAYSKLGPLINELEPDIIFQHGLQFRGSAVIARYVKKHPGTRLFVDNHSDMSNSATSWISKRIQHQIIWKYYAKLLEPYVDKFWGVLPARVTFLMENYDLPVDKCDLLVLGADDDEVARASNPDVRKTIRERFAIRDRDFLVVTGGKIDSYKIQTLSLMDAVAKMEDDVKLLVFGPVVPELRQKVKSRLIPDKIIHVPWATTAESYDYFSAADVVCFPGRHSVYWEQVVGMGKPLIVKRWDGTDHVDKFGNVLFLSDDTVDSIIESITKIRNSYTSYLTLSREAAQYFLYSSIAKRSIDEQ